MGNSLSVGQILHNQSVQKRELEEIRNQLADARDNDVLDSEIRRLNRSPYVGDRPYHKVRMLKGSQEEQDWKQDQIGEKLDRYISSSNTIDSDKLDVFRRRESQARAERLEQSDPSYNLKKLNII